MKISYLSSLLIVGSVFIAPSAFAFDDAANDFIGTYAFAHNSDLDVLSANVDYDGTNFNFSTTMAGNIGQTAGALYVWGFDRGQGTARFSPAIPNTDQILFDSVVILRPDTTASITRIVGSGGTTNLGAGTVTITGTTMTASIAATELPSLGFTTDDYTWNLWPRVGTGNNNQISDFAPDNGMVKVNAVPEPLTLVTIAACALTIRKRLKR